MLTLLLAVGLAVVAEPVLFPFPIPDLAQSAEAPLLDLSFLSPAPAGARGRLRPRGEQLVDGDGQVVRLFGSNICDLWPMLPKPQAEPSARRLQQLGINCVRFHYYDWDQAPSGILNPDRQTLNPAKLDQLDWFFAQLKAHGVYVDLNLHVARGYRDMPPGWDRMGKRIDYLHEPYIQSQLQFARELLSHRNPYTGQRYADDPAVALIELNNENTCLTNWGDYADLPERFAAPLRARWNDWLRARYATTDALRGAWGGALGATELLRTDDEAWQYARDGGEGSLTPAGEPGARYLHWAVTKPGTQFWHHQLMQTSVPVASGQTYTLRFRARCAAGGGSLLRPVLMMQAAPWKSVANGGVLRLSTDWRDYAVSLTCGATEGVPLRLNLDCDNTPGTYDLAALSLRAGEADPLTPAQRLETGTIALVGASGTRAQARDYVRFLLDCELDYVRRLRALIRDELGSTAIIECTQVGYGGPSGWLREEPNEVADQHAYPAHPREVMVEGRRHWASESVSMLRQGNAGLTSLARGRVAGKPFLVTEFDLNPPNDYAAETFPLLSTLAAYQGWSGIFDYSWYNFGASPGKGYFSTAFGTTGHSGQMALIPAAALAFRQGLIRPAATRTTLTVPRDTAVATTARNRGGWDSLSWEAAGVDPAAAWLTGLAVQLAPGGGEPRASTAVSAAGPAPLLSDTRELAYDRTPGRELLTVNAPAYRLVAGFVAGRRVTVGDVTFTFGQPLHRDWAIAALVSLDGEPLSRCARALLTVVNRVENTGMKLSADRSVALDWGRAPVLAQFVPLGLELPAPLRATPLTGDGRARGAARAASAQLQTEPGDETMWYLLTR